MASPLQIPIPGAASPGLRDFGFTARRQRALTAVWGILLLKWWSGVPFPSLPPKNVFRPQPRFPAVPSPPQATELIFKTPLFLFLGGQVAKLFQDSSLGNIVNILVTRLILLTEDQVSWALLSLSCVCPSLQELCAPPGYHSQQFPPVLHILPMPPEDWAEETSGNLIFSMIR